MQSVNFAKAVQKTVPALIQFQPSTDLALVFAARSAQVQYAFSSPSRELDILSPDQNTEHNTEPGWNPGLALHETRLADECQVENLASASPTRRLKSFIRLAFSDVLESVGYELWEWTILPPSQRYSVCWLPGTTPPNSARRPSVSWLWS